MYRTVKMPVVVARNKDQLASLTQLIEKLARFVASRAVVHEIADDQQLSRCIIVQQLEQTLACRRHSPHRHQSSGCALADFVTKV